MIREILRSGDPELRTISGKVSKEDLPFLSRWVEDLKDTLLWYRASYGAGRAIALPQIGIQKRVIYMLTDREVVFLNPSLEFPDGELFEVLDDCMSFPWVKVWVKRHKRAVIHYEDEQFRPCSMQLEGDLSELLQHEFDHLDGLLAFDRMEDKDRFELLNFGRASLSDKEEILSLWKEASKGAYTPWDEEYPGRCEAEKDLAAGNLFVLRDCGRIIGTVSRESGKDLEELSFWKQKEHVCEIARVGVLPSYQGNGIAYLMVRELEKRCKAEGLAAIHLLVETGNLPAVETYRKAGYGFLGEVKMYGLNFYACEKIL